MRQFQVLVIGVEDGTINKCDGIEHEGKLWLVPRWLDAPAQGVTRPARLIRFDSVPHQHTPNARDGIEYVINYPIPIQLFEIQTPKQEVPGFEFVEMPELTLPLPGKKLS
jgi:hypothetical protein